MSAAPGTRVGPYEILALLGSGGMGEVYKATDTRLGRTVAIKFLKREYTDRLDREARAIAALNHPHICTIHDVGPDYLVMEYLEGAPLGSLVPLENAIRLALQIAAALEAAHAKGITHRDLKPGNIFVTQAGVKLLDFGLAKLHAGPDGSDETLSLTQAGTVVGTAAYMSPEQAQAKPLDARSDIFSFGLVLYEMLSGQRAFSADTGIAIMAAIVRDEPRLSKVPPEMERIITRCLRKNPTDRFQTMGEVRAALEQVSVKAAQEQPSIAVLPFSNMSADKENEYFSDGLAEEILNSLVRIPGLKVTARTSSFAFRGKEQDIRGIAEALDVKTILEGSVRKAGNRVRVTAQLINAADGYHLWSERYDRELTDVFAVQDEIAAAIAGALKLKLSGEAAPVHRHTPSLPAYEAYLKGRHYMVKGTPEGWTRAKEYFEQAIALDPTFGQPHGNLGGQYFVLWANGMRPSNEVVPLIRSAARKAVELGADEAHALLGTIAATYDYDWKEAEREFLLALTAMQTVPEYSLTHASFFLLPSGRIREAVTTLEKAVESDPLNVPVRSSYAACLMSAELYDRAIEEARKGLEIDENVWIPYQTLIPSYLIKNMVAEALAAAEKAYQLAPWHPRVIGLLAGILARAGERARAKTLIDNINNTPGRFVAPSGMVLYHLICSEVEAAADWFEKAIEQRDPILLPWLRLPLTKPLRESPRWPRIAAMMNLPETMSQLS
jgi:TolB-like protein/predicted Ser/Thr protein kinase